MSSKTEMWRTTCRRGISSQAASLNFPAEKWKNPKFSFNMDRIIKKINKKKNLLNYCVHLDYSGAEYDSCLWEMHEIANVFMPPDSEAVKLRRAFPFTQKWWALKLVKMTLNCKGQPLLKQHFHLIK